MNLIFERVSGVTVKFSGCPVDLFWFSCRKMSFKGPAEPLPGPEMDSEKMPDAGYYKEQAIQCIRRGELREAALFLTTAIHGQSHPPDADLYCLRARVYIKLNMLYLAYEDAERAVIYRPNHPDVSEEGNLSLTGGLISLSFLGFHLSRRNLHGSWLLRNGSDVLRLGR